MTYPRSDRTADWFSCHGTDLEMRWDAVDDTHLTPTSRFFVRNHTTTPVLDRDSYRLQVGGDGLRAGNREASLSLGDLESLPQVEVTTAIECTGNGRRFFDTQQQTPTPGTPWELGAIGVARWGGPLLRDVLEVVGIRPDADEVMAIGLDPPYVADGEDHGHVRRPLPLAKALDDVLVALSMNGAPLPADHGYPARLVVPGWVGIASIKWLGRLEVTISRRESPWNTTWYRMHGGAFGDQGPVLTTMPVKSAFELARGARVEAGAPVELSGRSWSGRGAIEKVEVSTDGGETWSLAQLVGPNQPLCWTRWRVTWVPRAAGDVDLLAQATDTAGNVQPAEAAYNDDGYLFDAVVRHPVVVTG